MEEKISFTRRIVMAKAPKVPGFWKFLEGKQAQTGKTWQEIGSELGIHFTTINKARVKGTLLKNVDLEQLADVFCVDLSDLERFVPEEYRSFGIRKKASILPELESENIDLRPYLEVLVEESRGKTVGESMNLRVTFADLIEKLNSYYRFSKSINLCLSEIETKGLMGKKREGKI